jgi:hypothetical protein
VKDTIELYMHAVGEQDLILCARLITSRASQSTSSICGNFEMHIMWSHMLTLFCVVFMKILPFYISWSKCRLVRRFKFIVCCVATFRFCAFECSMTMKTSLHCRSTNTTAALLGVG